MAQIEVFNIKETSFNAYLSGLQTKDGDKDITYTRRCTWNVREKSSYNSVYGETELINPGKTEGKVHTISDLSPNTDYVVTCYVYNDDTDVYLDDFREDVTTKDGGTESPWTVWYEEQVDTATMEYDYEWYLEPENIHMWTFTPSKSGYVRIYTTGSVDTFGYLSGSPDMNSDRSEPASNIMWDDDSGSNYNFRMEMYVSAGAEYYIFVRGSSGSETGYVTLHITSPKDSLNTIPKWDWYSSNGKADATTTYNSYLALFDETKSTEEFSHEVWNDMVQKAYDIIWQKTKYWDPTYGTVASAKFSAEPYELTAKMFNSLRNNIELLGNRSDVLGYKTGISAVSSGDDVMGWYFTTLTEYMNDCIDNL